jgi:hypothetical protein
MTCLLLPTRARLLSLTLVALPLVAALLGSGCRSRCSADADCVKSCPCQEKGDGQEDRDTAQLCSIQLKCEYTFCEAEEGLICGFPGDNFCQKYAGGGLCGSRRCKNSDDCVKTCRCNADIPVPGSNPLRCCYRITVRGDCDQGADLCDVAYVRDCQDICQHFPVATTPPTCQNVCDALDQSGTAAAGAWPTFEKCKYVDCNPTVFPTPTTGN